MNEDTNSALHVQQDKMLDLYFHPTSPWTASRLAASFGYSETTVRKMVKRAKAEGRSRTCRANHDPRRREHRRPLSPTHDLLGVMVTRYCLANNYNMTKFGTLVGLSRLKAGELTSGYYDLTLTQLYRICEVIGTTVDAVMKHRGTALAV